MNEEFRPDGTRPPDATTDRHTPGTVPGPSVPHEHDIPAARMHARRRHLVEEIRRERGSAGSRGSSTVRGARTGHRGLALGRGLALRPGLALGAAATLVVVIGIAAAFALGRPAGIEPLAAILPDEPADGYVALVPRVLRSGETASFGISLLKGDRPVTNTVKVALVKQADVVAQAAARITGEGTIEMQVPRLATGEYRVTLQGAGFTDEATVRVQEGTLVFLETDKPVYKPGQTIQIRVMALDSELKPVADTRTTVEIQDAKAIKVFKRTVSTDEFGMAIVELPLSTEPNLGVWKLKAVAGDSIDELDVRVEEYVLPKYGVTVDLPKTWFLVGEPITGRVAAEYSFGRPVGGELRIKASRYVGIWEEFATYTGTIDGEGDFRIDPAGYVAGVPEAGGQGNVTLDVTVVEEGTGYEETTTEMVTVAAAPINIRLVPEGSVFKPGLPFDLLVVTETPDGEPVDAEVSYEAGFLDEGFAELGDRTVQSVDTQDGVGIVRLLPPRGAARMQVVATSGDAQAYQMVGASYSPSGNFVHVEQEGRPTLSIGDTARFHVVSTKEAGRFYYEVVARDRVVFSGSGGSDIAVRLTPAMAPSAKLLVYQILPNSEVAVDSLPFDVAGQYPQRVAATFSTDEARPGDQVTLDLQTEGPAKVGLAAVDRSVFILAENRLNLRQVFAELERLYMQPQAELHEAEPMLDPLSIPGARDTFEDAGLLVLTDKRVPEGRTLEQQWFFGEAEMAFDGAKARRQALLPATDTTMAAAAAPLMPETAGDLAEVRRVRQFFPETWIWQEALTDADGRASLDVSAPDSITTWDLRAVALSPERGLGIAETSLRVFQPFFLQADLPYSAIRGEEFPVKIALYNYLDTAQEITVRIEPAPWFDLLGDAVATVTVAGNEIGGVEFTIRPTGVGTEEVTVSARSAEAADAVVKSLIVEPEGVSRETVENLVLAPGTTRTIDLTLPERVVADSARAYVALTGSLLAQTIDGLDQLLQMPFGCGEQNMILFAPDTYILDYLEQTGQVKPEIQAKAEMLLTTGYQRELTYRRSDGSFSAFGESDPEGSLFLTAFVMKTFAQAKGLTFVDEAVLAEAADWITSHQKPDGSFESVGFVNHQELLGGIQGADSLTAYVTVALLEAGQTAAADKALAYLEDRLDAIDEPYPLALTTYALALGGSDRATQARDRLMTLAIEDEDGLHWPSGEDDPLPLTGGGVDQRLPAPEGPGVPLPIEGPDGMRPAAEIEATGYATLALVQLGDRVDASRSATWLVGQRNSMGGFGSTQDTVVALQALTTYAALVSADTDLTVTLIAGDVEQQVHISPADFDVVRTVEVPAGVPITLRAQGHGEAVVQGVLRYNLPEPEKVRPVFDISVEYDTTQVEVDDLVTVDVDVTFDPPEPLTAGMVVVDVSVPTGFAAVEDSLERLLEVPTVKRYDIAGRKIIVYLEDIAPGESVAFSFQVRALYPVRAKGAASQVYSYYTPAWRGETVSEALDVR